MRDVDSYDIDVCCLQESKIKELYSQNSTCTWWGSYGNGFVMERTTHWTTTLKEPSINIPLFSVKIFEEFGRPVLCSTRQWRLERTDKEIFTQLL